MAYLRIRKSQVAIEYCYRFKDRHADSNIFWVHAGTKERFEQAFKAIAKKCKLPGWDDPATNPLDLVYDWLSGDTTWLMILDNADDKDVFFDQRPTANSQIPEAQRSSGPLITYLPQTSRGGSVLITSRNRDVAFRLTDSVKNLIDVPYMSKEDAVALLCKKLPDDQSSDEEKFELVELLEYLPLAITQAASYISAKRTRMTIARYSNILRKNEDILLRDMGDLRRDPTIPSSVLLTWHISFDQINEENRPAAELLFLMSVLDRQGIPQYLFQNEDKDDLDFENRLAPLEEFSLITLEDSDRSFQMHRLVQMAIRSWLERHGEIDRWKQSAAELVAENLPIAEYPFWKTWEILLPHSEVTLDYVSSSMKSQLVHVRILHHTACYFIERGRYDAARERCQRALDIQQDLLPEDDIRVAHSLSTLATLKYFSGDDRRIDIDEAEALSRRAVDIFERVQGKDHYNSMGARNTLAFTLLDTGHDRKIQEATEILRSILASKEQSLGLEHLETLESMNSLALALAMQHRYDEAEKLYRITLQTSFRRHGEDHPRTITSMENLAFLLNNRKKYEEAQDFAQRALDLRMRVLGEEHPHTLSTMILLSGILSSQGEAGEAEGLCRYALALHKTVFGSGASKTMECTYTLGQILANQHKYAEAEELFREVYNNRPRGWNDKVWNLFLDEFADTVAKQGKHDEAAEISSQRIPSEDEGSYLSNTSVTESPPQTRNASPTESLLEVPEIRRRMTA